MGIFDKLKQDTDDQGGSGTSLQDKAEQMAGSAGLGNAADQGLDKAGQMLDEKTGNKYSGQIDTGVNKAKDYAGQQFGQQNTPGGDGGQAQQQPTDPNQQTDPNQAMDPNQQTDPNQADPNQQMDQPPQNY